MFAYLTHVTHVTTCHNTSHLEGISRAMLAGEGAMRHAEDAVEEGDAFVTRCHHLAHKYAKKVGQAESTRDKLTYHSAVLLEWSHGKCCTIVELAW